MPLVIYFVFCSSRSYTQKINSRCLMLSFYAIILYFVAKEFVTHNDILSICRTIALKKYFYNILRLSLKYFRNKCISNQSLCKKVF